MKRIATGKTWIGLGMALEALAFTVGCASTTSDADESLEVAEQALVDPRFVGARLPCSLWGPTPTGKVMAFLVVDRDRSTCYWLPEPGHPPAPGNTPNCQQVGLEIGCDTFR